MITGGTFLGQTLCLALPEQLNVGTTDGIPGRFRGKVSQATTYDYEWHNNRVLKLSNKKFKIPPGGSYLFPQYWQILRTNSTEQLKATDHWIPVSMPWVLTNTISYKQSWKVKATTLLCITVNSETSLWWLNTEARDCLLLIIISCSQIWSNRRRFHRYEGTGTVTVDRKGDKESNSQELQVPVWYNQFLVQIRYARYYF